MNSTKLASSQCNGLHSSIRKKHCSDNAEAIGFFLGGGGGVNLQLLKIAITTATIMPSFKLTLFLYTNMAAVPLFYTTLWPP